MTQQIGVELVRLENGKDLPLPKYGTEDSAGLDLIAAVSEEIILASGERCLVPCGFSIALPKGYEAQIRPRSGLAFKDGITVLNAPGTIDADYRGEIKVLLINFGDGPFVIQRGMKIAQMVIAPYQRIEWQEKDSHETSTKRGEGGFGSTGTHAA